MSEIVHAKNCSCPPDPPPSLSAALQRDRPYGKDDRAKFRAAREKEAKFAELLRARMPAPPER